MKQSKLWILKGEDFQPALSELISTTCHHFPALCTYWRGFPLLFLNLLLSGMRKHQTRVCQVSPAPCVQALKLFLTDMENVLCVRPWHSHSINSLSSRLLSKPSHCYCCISSPSTPKWQCWILALTPSLSRASAEPNLQIRLSHLLPQSTLGMLNTISERCMLI